MSLKDTLLPLADRLRGIPSRLGFRTYQVWVRLTESAGPRSGVGAKTVTGTRLLVGGQDPKVRIVSSKDIAAGRQELQRAEFEIGPLTPAFAGGGIDYDLINPPQGPNAATLSFLIKGPGLPDDGLVCTRLSDRVDQPLRVMIRVKGAGRSGT